MNKVLYEHKLLLKSQHASSGDTLRVHWIQASKEGWLMQRPFLAFSPFNIFPSGDIRLVLQGTIRHACFCMASDPATSHPILLRKTLVLIFSSLLAWTFTAFSFQGPSHFGCPYSVLCHNSVNLYGDHLLICFPHLTVNSSRERPMTYSALQPHHNSLVISVIQEMVLE